MALQPPETPPPPDVRISIRLSPEARDAIAEIMRLRKMDSIQEAVRRAIGDELLLSRERAEGWKVLLQKGNKYREVSWPPF